MDSALKPVDLYDIARMCVQAYQPRPSVAGWRALHPADLRLSEAGLAGLPYVNRTALAFWRPSFGKRRAMMVTVVRGDRGAGDDTGRTVEEAAAGIRAVVQAALSWAARAGVEDVVVAAHGVGVRVADLACEGLGRGDADARVTLVAFGEEEKPLGGLPRIDVLRDGERPNGAADQYLHDIRTLYEAGDLAEMLRDDGRHTVIRIPAAARQ